MSDRTLCQVGPRRRRGLAAALTDLGDVHQVSGEAEALHPCTTDVGLQQEGPHWASQGHHKQGRGQGMKCSIRSQPGATAP